jgi:hypothetical protein
VWYAVSQKLTSVSEEQRDRPDDGSSKHLYDSTYSNLPADCHHQYFTVWESK